MCSEVGINIKVNLIGGFPTQTKNELINELEHIYDFLKNIDISKFTLAFNPFLLFKDSEIFLNPQKFNIKIKENRMFSPCVFEQLDKDAISPVEAAKIFNDFVGKLPKKFKKVFTTYGIPFSFFVKSF